MKKKLLAFLLAVMMVAALVPTMLLPAAAIDWYNGYVTAKVGEGAISVDASAIPDAAYANSEKIVSTLHYDNLSGSGETSSFYGYTAADELGVYFWFNITDESLNKGDGYDKIYTDPETMEDIVEHFVPVGPSQGDKFEIYIKAAGAMSSASRAIGAFEFDYIGQINSICVKYPVNYTNVNGDQLGFDATLVDFEVATYDDAWVLEAYIPFEALGGDFVEMTIDDLTGYQIGLQANNMDNDDSYSHNAYCYDTSFGGGYYLGMSGGHGYSANNSHQGSHCVPLSFAGFRTAVVTTAPVVDGKMDASYLKSEKIDAYDAGGKGKNFTAYTAATAEGYYIYADIIDDTLDKAPETGVDQGDKFQVYFQMGNRFSNRDWGYIELDYRTEGDVVPFRIVSKGPFADNTFDQILVAGIKYATTKKADGSGWTAELFIPWAGRMADNNFDELTGTTMAIALQVNNYTDNGSQITYNLSDAFGGTAWSAYNGASGVASGNFFCAPVIFDFDVDDGAKNIIRWANYSETDLALDGVMDAAYNELASEKVDFTYIQTDGYMGYARGWSDYSFATVYYAFTDTDVYVLVDVVDDTVAPARGDEFVSIFFENSDSIAKFALSPFNGGEYITNATYFGKTVALPATGSAYAENDMIALKIKGTADNYTGYTVEFKLPLTDTEKAALAAGEAVSIGMGYQINNANAEGARDCYSYNVPYGNLFWQNGADILGGTALPKVRLDKNITEDNIGDFNGDNNVCEHLSYTNGICDNCGYITLNADFGELGKGLVWVFDPDTNVLTIMGEGYMDTEFWFDGWDYSWDDGGYTDLGWDLLFEGSKDAWEYAWEYLVPAPWYEYLMQIESVIIKEGVTNIAPQAFVGCENLESIYIPTSVTNIGYGAFGGCYSLRNVYYIGTADEWNIISIAGENDYLTSANISYNSCYHQWDDGTVIKEPTHHDEGEKIYICSDCGGEKFVTLPIIDHTWDDGTVIKEPTHYDEGEKIYICSDCGDEKIEEVPKLSEHTFGDWSKYDNDSHVRSCACGYSEYATHARDNGTVIEEPTHTKVGTMLYICSECGHEKIEEIPTISGHTYGDWTYYSTSQHAKECECGEKIYEAHTWDKGTVTEEATHTKVGTKLYICSDCGGEKTEDIPVLSDHVWGDWTPNGEYQHMRVCECGKKEYAAHAWGAWESYDSESHMRECVCGSVKYAAHTFVDGICKDCGYDMAGDIPGTGGDDHFDGDHIWDDGVINTAPTHTTEGLMIYTCECGAIKKEILDKLEGHEFGDWVSTGKFQHTRSCECGKQEYAMHAYDSGVITTEPTYTTTGIKTYTCVCGYTKTETVPVLEPDVHTCSYGDWANYSDTQHVRACECGNKEYAAHTYNSGVVTTAPTHINYGVKTYTCPCGAIKTEQIAKLTEHTYDDGVITTEPTHVDYGVKTFSCLCGATYTETVEKLPDHEWNGGVITTAPTYTTDGIKTYTCPCGATKTETIPHFIDPENAAQLVISAPTALVGETVQITVSIKNNPGFGAVAFALPIDTDLFEFVEFSTSGSICRQFGICDFDSKVNKFKFNGLGNGIADITSDGLLVTITLRVKDTVEAGNYTFNAIVDKKNTASSYEGPIEVADAAFILAVTTHTCSFGEWTSYDDNNHARYCECGEAEYAAHEWDDGYVFRNPTHTKNGIMKYSCDCGKTRTESIDKLPDHEWDSGVITTAPTHLEYGIFTYTCTCKETYTERIDKLPDHEWDSGVITTAPTHLEYGVKTYTCPCGATKTEQVAKLPDHTFGSWSNFDDNNHARYCECGAKELEAHSWDEGTVISAPTYVVEGEMTYKCDCGAIRREVIATLPVTETSPKLIIEGATAMANNNVKITVRLENNPGVWGVAFALPIDSEIFEFVSADTSESVFKQFGICGYDETTSEYKFNGYNNSLMSNVTADGTVVVITLKVKDGVEAGEYKLQSVLSEKDIINANGNRVSLAPVEGIVEVIDYILGDVNGDGYISNADVLMIFRYIYNSAMYPLAEVVADVNHDGYVSNADVLCIFRYIYNPTLYPIV